MIEFIMNDEQDNYIKLNNKLIEKVMMNTDEDYEITKINLKDEKWTESLEKKTFKIFILNINSRKNSGIDIGRYIRVQKNDWQSLIIFTAKTDEYLPEVSKSRFFIIDYVEKLNPCYEKRLEEAIQIALRNFDTRPKTLKYSYKNVFYNLELSKIIYIEKEQDSKRCIIYTSIKNYFAPGNLHTLEQKLDKRFIKCNRSYIINLEQVEYYDIKNNLITFKDESTLDIISKSKKKEIISYLRGI